jgi:hypothetical protein
VTVDAQPLARGLTAYMASQALVVPLPDGRSLRGHVALPRAPGPARLWLLQHGVVVTHQGLAQAPSFEAALELGALLGPRATPADLRAAISPLLPVLTAAAVELMLALSSRAQGLSLAAQSWLLALLLEAARLGYQRAAIGEAAVIPALLGEDEGGGAPSLISIAALRGRSERDHAGQAVALALDPDQPRRDLLRGGAPLALLDAAARSTITELYGLRFRPPGRRPARARALARGSRGRHVAPRSSSSSASVAAPRPRAPLAGRGAEPRAAGARRAPPGDPRDRRGLRRADRCGLLCRFRLAAPPRSPPVSPTRRPRGARRGPPARRGGARVALSGRVGAAPWARRASRGGARDLEARVVARIGLGPAVIRSAAPGVSSATCAPLS